MYVYNGQVFYSHIPSMVTCTLGVCMQYSTMIAVGALPRVMLSRSDCVLVFGSTTKGDVVKRSDCVLMYGSTSKGGVVKR